MSITYTSERSLSPDEFIDLLNRSTLGKRRPVDDADTIRGMVENTNLIVTAWDNTLLVGLARSMTDFHYACYLSDLAVDQNYQRQGIGKHLLQLTVDKLGANCKLLLVSAPDANDYYPALGFEACERTWVLPRGGNIQ